MKLHPDFFATGSVRFYRNASAIKVLRDARAQQRVHPQFFETFATGELSRTIIQDFRDRCIYCIRVSPDGTNFVFGSATPAGNVSGLHVRLHIWKVDGEELYSLDLGTFDVRSLVGNAVFTPDGTKVASLLLGTLTVWDVLTRKNLYSIDVSTELIAFAVSPDGKKIAYNAGKGENAFVCHMDMVTGEQLELEGNGVGVCFAFSSEGKRVVSGSKNGEVWVWDTDTGETLLSLEGHTELVRAVAFSPDGSKIVTASYDKTARLWDASTGTLLHILEGHTDFIADVGFSSHGEKIVTGSSDNTLRVWDTLDGKELQVYRGHNRQVISVEFSSDRTKIVSAGANHMICTWDAEWKEEEMKYLSLPAQTQIPPELPDPPNTRKCLRDRFAVFKWLHRSGGEDQESD